MTTETPRRREVARVPQVQLPPPESLPAAVRKAAGELQRLTVALAAEARKLADRERAREHAVAEDRRALAKAIAAGKGDPGMAALDNADDELAAAGRRVDALELAAQEAHAAVIAAVKESRAEWQARAEREAVACAEAFAGQVEALAEAHDQLASAYAVAGWLERFPIGGPFNPAGWASRVIGVTLPNGDDAGWPLIVAALREHGKPK